MPERSPLVDVLLPTHRRPHTIGCAMDSVLKQSIAALRLHIVCDGCDERTERAVNDRRDGRVCFHRASKVRGSGTANVNAVLKQCTAPYVAYMTDDDLWFPDHLERAIDALDERRVGLVAARVAQVLYPDTVDAFPFAFDWSWGPWRRYCVHRFIGIGALVHRRRLLGEIGGLDERLTRFADVEFFSRARRSSVGASYTGILTVLRFFARDWDHRYSVLAEPPQQRYLKLLGDPRWRDDLRARARDGPRSSRVRGRQLAGFARVGMHSGIPYLRTFIQRAVCRRTPPQPWADGCQGEPQDSK